MYVCMYVCMFAFGIFVCIHAGVYTCACIVCVRAYVRACVRALSYARCPMRAVVILRLQTNEHAITPTSY